MSDEIKTNERRSKMEKEYLATMDFYRNNSTKYYAIRQRYNRWIRNGKPVVITGGIDDDRSWL